MSSSSTDSSSTTSSLAKPLRTPRFAEATTVHSPIEPRGLPFSEKTDFTHAQPGDVGFGSPLKSAMKVPGTPGRGLQNPLSPTFKEEQILEDREKNTDKEQARDIKIKTRVRMAKFALRGVNFSCSLIILSMISASFAIFHATKTLPALSGLPPWAANTNTWPQKVVLACACVSLLICIAVFIGYCRGGHRRAEKVGVYYTLFAVGWFIFSMAMWAAAAGILQYSRSNTGNKDMWGWACVQNRRSQIFGQQVDYALVCRLQDWTLICIIIELVVEIISISLYSIVFYRYWSKRKLRKSMDTRDKARSDLYLAQLRTQSAPTPPVSAPSPRLLPVRPLPALPSLRLQIPRRHRRERLPFTPAARGSSSRSPPSPAAPPPATPLPPRPPTAADLSPTGSSSLGATPPVPIVTISEHAPLADGETQYEAVPIPGAYAGQALKSPPPVKTSFGL
ncbi:hypothetical protein N0V88_004133 [Collariella sp. IMI 366227]|nr:hypothetical protein N0V88_004133 [Collariella sp. IMI 366227]